MAVRPPQPKWQTVVSFLFGLALIAFEATLNAITGRPVDVSLIGAAVGIALGGPVLSKSSRKGHDDNDDADSQ